VKEKELLLTINGSPRLVDILEIGDLVPFKFQVSEKLVFFRPSMTITFRVTGV